MNGSPFAHAVTWVALLSVFGFGVVMALLGAIKLKIAEKLKLDDAQVGKLISALLFTSLIMVLVSGPFLDAFGHRLTIILGFLITCVGITVIGYANSYSTAIIGCIIMGIGGSGLNTGGNTLIVYAVQPLPAKLIFIWFIGDIFQMVIAGAILGAIYKPAAGIAEARQPAPARTS